MTNSNPNSPKRERQVNTIHSKKVSGRKQSTHRKQEKQNKRNKVEDVLTLHSQDWLQLALHLGHTLRRDHGPEPPTSGEAFMGFRPTETVR